MARDQSVLVAMVVLLVSLDPTRDWLQETGLCQNLLCLQFGESKDFTSSKRDDSA